MKWVKPVSNLRLAMWATAVLIFAESFMFSVPAVHAEAVNSWNSTTSLPSSISATDNNWQYIIQYNGYLYFPAAHLGQDNAYYATINQGVVGTWTPTTVIPYGGAKSYPDSIQCLQYNGYANCLYNDYGAPYTNYAYYSKLSSSGFGAWTSTNIFANSGNGDDIVCANYLQYAICATDSANNAGTGPIDYSTMSATGGFSAWASTGRTTPAASASCPSSGQGSSAYVTSIGGVGYFNLYCAGTIYYAKITNGLLGSFSTASGPHSNAGAACFFTTGYVYCVAGSHGGGNQNNVDYSLIGTGGSYGSWTSTTAYPITNVGVICLPNSVNYITCFGGVSSATYYAALAGFPAFTCTINNMDAGNNLLPNGKAYDFQCIVNSLALPAPNGKITDVRIQFNDSLHVIVADYSNNTNVAYGIGFSILNGSQYATLSNSGNVVSTYDASTGIRTMTVDFLITLTPAILDASNRGIQLLALGANPLTQTRGYEYVQTNYFNIINLGGGISVLKSGACSIYPGSDTFQAACHYGANAHNWIAENATYPYLQSYQTQFFLETDNQTSAGPTFTQNGPQLGYFWQPYSQSGAGTNPSSNKGDFTLRYGLYHYDNTTWVKGINVLLETGNGRVGSSNLWTEFDALWYNGATLIANQTLYAFVPDTALSQVQLYVYLWYSQNNASTVQGGQVQAYYTGMHKSNYLLWSTWSPFLQNQTQSQVFMPLLDHSGNVMSAQTAQFTKVFMNLTRPGAPLVNTKQYNFQIQTGGFKEQEFNTAQPNAMAGIVTPTFATVIVPTISSSSIFTPIVNALKALASWIAKATVALGTYVWNVLGQKFPWFTNFWTLVGSWTVQSIKFIGLAALDVIGILVLIPQFFGPVTTIVGLIGSAWGTIQGVYLPIFKGANLSAMITLATLWIFAGWFLENAQEGNTTEIARGATLAWRIFNAILYWTFWFVKLMIDTIEGLIP